MTSSRNKAVEVRDARNQPFFWIDKLFMDGGYAERVGIYGIAVYMVLSYRSNKEGKCWPSQNSIAKLIGCSVNSVVRAVIKLREVGLISTHYEGVGPDSHIVYTLHTIPPIRGDNPPCGDTASPLLDGLIPPDVTKNNNHRTTIREQQPLTKRKFTDFKDEREQMQRVLRTPVQ